MMALSEYMHYFSATKALSTLSAAPNKRLHRSKRLTVQLMFSKTFIPLILALALGFAIVLAVNGQRKSLVRPGKQFRSDK